MCLHIPAEWRTATGHDARTSNVPVREFRMWPFSQSYEHAGGRLIDRTRDKIVILVIKLMRCLSFTKYMDLFNN